MDYTYAFSDFTDSHEPLQAIHHRAGKVYKPSVRIDDSALVYGNAAAITPTLADLIDLAAAIYVADWLSPRKINARHNIRVVLPVRNPSLLSKPAVLEGLSQLLGWYTGDRWHFEFHLRQKAGRLLERRPKLISFDEAVEVALWSGGLDSLAGLCGRMSSNAAPRYTLVGTGSNKYSLGKQNEIATGLLRQWPKPIKLIQLPIHIRYFEEADRPPTNDKFRARGFVFKVLGSVCSCLEGQDTLYIYENGYGALNLRFQLSQGEMDHTRAVHPLSLLDTADFISDLLNIPFNFENPYLFSTKAEMCDAVRECASLAFSTVSCDGRHRQADQPSQCGYCSSCLLRRMALLIALGEDHTKYVITHGTVSPQPSYYYHFEAMRRQVLVFTDILSSHRPWQKLVQRHPRLRTVVRRLATEQHVEATFIQDRLLQLYRSHVNEWQLTEAILQSSLVTKNREQVKNFRVPNEIQ